MKKETILLAFIVISPFIATADVVTPVDLTPVRMLKTPEHAPVPLIKNKKIKTDIYIAPKSGSKTRKAVSALRHVFKRLTGSEAEFVKKIDRGKPTIVVGDCFDAENAGVSGKKMPIEGFEIKTAPDRVFIVGHDDAGTAWGVFDFIERFMGVRFYWPGDEGMSLPVEKDIVVAPAHIADHPAFRKREIWPSGGRRVSPDVGPHHLRLRSNDSWPVKLIVHAPHDWRTKYQKTRPEIFQLQGDGRRNFDMLCYGDPKTLETYLEEIESQIDPKEKKKNFRASIVKDKSITVSPADMAVSCKCEHCRKLWANDGGPYGTASKIMANFVRKLADEVKKRYPDMTIIFLPYKNYTYAPEGVEFPGNVEVQICGMPGLAQHKDDVINKSEQANIDAWIKASGRKIQNWHYDCWPADRTKAAYHYPHTIKKHYLTNKDKTVGSFINGVKDHWPRQNFSLYTWMKCLWNPEFDVDAAFEEYCRRMFGPASNTMKELISMQMNGWENREWSSHKFSPKSVYEESFPRKDVIKMEALFSKAREEAKNDEMVMKRLNYLAPALNDFFAESKQLSEGTGTRALRSFQVAENPVIDGKLDDECWRTIAPLDFVRATDKKNPKPNFPTILKSVWSRDGITFGLRMTDPESDRLAKKHGPDSRDASLIWWDDNVEIFLDVMGERVDYFHFIVNCDAAIFDAHGKDFGWNAAGMKAASYVGKDFWSLEVYIPFDSFKDHLAPGTGVKWFGNFTRHRVTDRKNREYQRLNTTYSPSSSDQNAFGPIQFIER